jgi:hypothetical protein
LTASLDAKAVETDHGFAPGVSLNVQGFQAGLFAWIEVGNGDSIPNVMMRQGSNAPTDVYKPQGTGSTTLETQRQVEGFVDEVIRAMTRSSIAKDAQDSLGRTLKSLRRPGN